MRWFDGVLALIDPETYHHVSRARINHSQYLSLLASSSPPVRSPTPKSLPFNGDNNAANDSRHSFAVSISTPLLTHNNHKSPMPSLSLPISSHHPNELELVSNSQSGNHTTYDTSSRFQHTNKTPVRLGEVSVRHGLLTHVLTPWDVIFGVIVRRRVLAVFSAIAFLLLLIEPGFSLPGSRGQVYVWSSVCQSIFMGLILLSQRVAKWRAKQGKEFAAKVIFVPAFETLLWMLFCLTLIDLNLMTEESPKYPHFIEVYYRDKRDIKLHVSDPFQYFLHTFVESETLIWAMPFLFVEHSLSRTALKRAMQRSAAMSLVTASICVFGYICEVQWSLTTLSVLAIWTSRDLLGLVVFSWLIFKAAKSSRRSIIPFAVICSILCIISMLVTMTLFQSVSSELRDPLIAVESVFECVFFNLSLIWTLYLDTMYWRGVTRIPIWCARTEFSPYGQIDDALIQRQIPKLIDHRSLEFIDFAFLEFGPLLGAGATSQVFKGRICYGAHAGKEVAIKVFTPLEISQDTLADFANEIHKFENLHHDRLIELVGVCVRPPDVCMVCELCARGSLHQFLRATTLTSQDKMRLCVQACEAVAFIHNLSPPLIHRDLKSQNFLVTDEGDLKLSDFGTSKQLDPNRKPRSMSTCVGSLPWMSPEILAGSDDYDLTADIYSLGIVLWEIWAQADPHGNIHPNLIRSRVVEGLRPQIPASCPPAVAFLMETMWSHEPKSRPSATQAFEAFVMLFAGI